MSFCAVIFDMDETLVASGSIWKRAELKLFDLIGKPYNEEVARLYKGKSAMDVGRTIYTQYHPENLTADECGRMLRQWLIEEFHGEVCPMPGADSLVKNLAGKIDMAVASGSPSEAISGVLDRFGWTDCFKAVVSSEEVEKGKPEPDVFLEAAHRLGCPPENVLVFEDSIHGVHAAKKAGMTCFVVPSTDNPAITGTADRSFSSLSEISLKDILGE